MTTTETRANRKKPPNGTNDPSNPRRTSSFVTDFTAKDTGRLGTGDRQSKPPPSVQNCLCCSGSHKLASCLNYKTKISQVAGILWNVIGCLLFVWDLDIMHRDRCESQRLCPRGSDKQHHRLLHNPPRRDTAETSGGNQTCEGGQQPPGKTPIPENGEQPNSTEVRSTVQYATVTEPTKKKTILLHVIPVKISSSDVKSITTYGLIDNGSSAVLDFRKKILGPAGPQVFIFGRQNKYSSRQKLYLRINGIQYINLTSFT